MDKIETTRYVLIENCRQCREKNQNTAPRDLAQHKWVAVGIAAVLFALTFKR